MVSGLLVEARMASGSGVRALAGGGNGTRLGEEIARAVGDGAGGILSFGMAGGLEPGLAAGSIVVPDAVLGYGLRFATDAAWTRQLRARLPGSLARPLAGTDRPITEVAGKARLHADTGAAAVDMESHLAARAAARATLPVAAVRVIADPAHRAVPAAAIAAMGEDGRVDVRALVAALVRDPRALAALTVIAADARRAIAVLTHCKRLLGPLLLPPPPPP